MDSSREVDDRIRHKTSIINQIYEYWEDGKYCDVTFKIGPSTLKCHKLVLAACFKYFRGLFDMNSGSNNNSCDKSLSHESCDLSDVDYNSFYLLIEYAYTGKIKLTSENVQNILVAADYFGNDHIKRECEELMLQNIDMDNCIDLVSFAEQYSLPNLQTCVINFIGKNFETLLVNGTLQSMPLESFMKLYKTKGLLFVRKNVLVSSKLQEQLLFKAALIYCMSRPEVERENILYELLKCVRLPLIEPEILNEELKQQESMLRLPSIKQMIDLAIYIQDVGADALTNRDIPSVWKSRRMLTHHLVDFQYRVACNNQAGRPEKWIDDTKDIGFDEQIRNITIWTRYWLHFEVISGIQVRYRGGTVVKCGGRVKDPNVFVAEHEFELEDGEVITKVIGSEGWLIDSITFHTSFDRSFGSFGGSAGVVFIQNPLDYLDSEYDFIYSSGDSFEISEDSKTFVTEHLTESRYPEESAHRIIDKTMLYPYLHGIIAGEIITKGHIAITHLGCLWACFKKDIPVADLRGGCGGCKPPPFEKFKKERESEERQLLTD